MTDIDLVESVVAPTRPTGLIAVDGRTFPLRSARLRAAAEGGLAQTTLIQEYDNPHAEPLEVLYTMPLPADGAVAAYTFHLGGRVVTGRIETRDKAAAAYREALAAGRTAGLLEQERADTFTQSLGNLPPGARVTVEIEVLQPLAFEPGGAEPPCWEYRFPTVVGVRYEGKPGRVPDAGKLDAPRADELGTPVRLEAELRIGDGAPATTLPRSPSHTFVAEADGAATVFRLDAPSRLDRDVIVRWAATGPAVEARILEGRGLPEDVGRYALLTVTPPAAPQAALERDVTILLDASGSMGGEPIAAAKRVIEELLGSLAQGDRFEIQAFSSKVRQVTDGFVEASPDAVAAAVLALRGIHSGGGTEMTAAIEHALAPLRPGSQRQVVLITDGFVGFESQVVAHVLEKLPEGARLHVVGVGSAPNRALTRCASRAGRGVEVLVGLRDDAGRAASRLVRATAAPVLTGVIVRGAAVRGVAPERPRDVFAGDALRLLVEIAAEGGEIEISARLAGSPEPWVRRFTVGPEPGTVSKLALGAFYGREAVEDAEMSLAAGDRGRKSTSEITARIETLGLRHRIVTRCTSLVAILEDPTVDPTDPRRRQRLAVEVPEGVSAEGAGLLGAVFADSSMVFSAMAIPRSAMPRWTMEEPPSRLKSRVEETVFGLAPAPAMIDGRIVSAEGDLVVLELEVPVWRLELPPDAHEVEVTWDDGSTSVARVVAALGTRGGRHAPGLTVRIAVRLETARLLPARPVHVAWAWHKGRIEVSLAP